jgi:hypothetical protein
MEWVNQVKQLLQGGVYVNNLRSIVDISSNGLNDRNSILPAYIIKQIAVNILDYWEGRPLRVTEQRFVEDAIRPPFEAVLDNMLRKAPQTEIIASLEGLVRTWVETHRRPTPR